MSMKALEDLRRTLCSELDEISKKKEINTQMLENIWKLTSSIKNIDKIMMAGDEEMGYSQAGNWNANIRGTYGDGNSYANRGQHYVRGHYSRDGYDMRDGYSEKRGGGRYSRDGGTDTREMLHDMLDNVDDRELETLKRHFKEMSEK